MDVFHLKMDIPFSTRCAVCNALTDLIADKKSGAWLAHSLCMSARELCACAQRSVLDSMHMKSKS